jgi:hypothetical protein
MTRISEAQLIDFCVRQQEDFEASAWMNYPHLPKPELAAVALFLAGMDWYGHGGALRGIAGPLEAGCVGHFAALAKRTGFDCGRFSNLLRRFLGHAPFPS